MPQKKGNILVIDDNKSLLSALELLLSAEFNTVKCISNPNILPLQLKEHEFDVVLLDMNFRAGINSGNEGIYWLQEIKKLNTEIMVIMITAYGDVKLAVKAMKKGACDFILKPWEDEKLIATIKNTIKLKHSKLEVKQLKDKQSHLKSDLEKPSHKIIGESQAMQELYRKIAKVAQTDANILILGENGTGKELVAREIHKQSLRKGQIMLSIDIGSLSESLFESELFGYTKGAFTDAKEDRAGRFETASGGTIFLDELGNISTAMQAKLLSVLEKRTLNRLGSSKEVSIDVRLISATNKNLKELVANNTFREDLLYRVNTIEIVLPPLRERGDDIILLANYYLKHYALKYTKGSLRFSADAYKKLKSYSWPGNIRELRHNIEKAVILSETNIIAATDIQIHSDADYVSTNQTLSLEDIEKMAILKILRKHNWNHSHTASELKIARTTLLRKLKKYGLT